MAENGKLGGIKKMIMSKKIRLYPTKEQEQKMWQSVGVARFVYNWTINKQQENYNQGKKFINDNELRKEITQLKKNELIWLSEVSNDVAKQSVKDACISYKRFFNGLSKSPKFKNKKKSKPSFYNDSYAIRVCAESVLLTKIGWIKIKPNQIPTSPCKYFNPRISNDGKYWYLSLGIEKDTQVVELTKESLGIDVGIKDLAICSNGMVFKNINKEKNVKQIKKRLKRLQRKVSNKYQKNKNGNNYVKTNNIIKSERQIKLLYRRLTNIRNNHLHQSTTAIVKTKPSKIVMETLNIKGMMKNNHVSKALSEQCLYEFKRQIKYKCECNGIEFVEADKWFASSKICSGCGNKKEKLLLSERIYKCEKCGLVIDRDYNASINLSKYQLV